MRAAAVGLTLLLIVSSAGAEVTLIRKLPQTSENRTEAEWTKPRPQPEQSPAVTQFSARIIIGGQGGVSADGDQQYDVYTDSSFSLAQPLGAAVGLQMGGSALRKRHLDGREQSYTADFDLTAERWSAALSGSYRDSERTLSELSGLSTEDVEKQDMDLLIASTVNASFMPTLPMSLSYEHGWIQQAEDADKTEDRQSDTLTFLTEGTLGTLGLEMSASVERTADASTEMNTFSSSGSLAVNVPLLSFLHLRPGLSPVYTRTEYANGDQALSTALDADLGLYFPLSESLESRLVAGRVDTWSNDREGGVEQNVHQVTWKGETGVDWQPSSGLFSSAEYTIAATGAADGEAQTQSHGSALALGWRNPANRGWLRTVETGADLNLVTSGGDGLETLESHWNAGLDLEPVETMTLSGDYSGTMGEADTPAAWTHTLATELSHAPDPLLNYQLAASFTDQATGDGHTYTTDGLGQVTLLPQWNLKVYTVSVGENLVFSVEPPDQDSKDVLARTFFSAGVPLSSFIQLRYNFDWEWVNRISETGPAGNAFRHLTGLTISGELLPFSLTADYGLSHGFRGLRHDFNAILDIPFQRGFGIKGNASLSRYRENGVTVTPFLLGLNGVYEY